jgi:hypothetical protein
LTLRTLSQERDRLHVNYSIFDQNSINGKFIAKKTSRDNKNKKRIHTINGTTLNDENDDTNHPNLGTVESDDGDIHFENTNVKTNISAPIKKDTNSNPNPKQNQNQNKHVDHSNNQKSKDNNQVKKPPQQHQQHQQQSDQKKKQQSKPQHKNISGDEQSKNKNLKLGEDNRKGHKKQNDSDDESDNDQQEDIDDIQTNNKKQKTK